MPTKAAPPKTPVVSRSAASSRSTAATARKKPEVRASSSDHCPCSCFFFFRKDTRSKLMFTFDQDIPSSDILFQQRLEEALKSGSTVTDYWQSVFVFELSLIELKNSGWHWGKERNNGAESHSTGSYQLLALCCSLYSKRSRTFFFSFSFFSLPCLAEGWREETVLLVTYPSSRSTWRRVYRLHQENKQLRLNKTTRSIWSSCNINKTKQNKIIVLWLWTKRM